MLLPILPSLPHTDLIQDALSLVDSLSFLDSANPEHARCRFQDTILLLLPTDLDP